MEVRNEKARRYLSAMRKKSGIPFSEKFPGVDPSALELLKQLLAFDSRDRPTAEQALRHEYFKGLGRGDQEPTSHPISKLEFAFERHRLTKDDVRALIYQEILEYHPQMLKDYRNDVKHTSFMFPSAVDRFKRQFAHLEDNHEKQGINDNNGKHCIRALDRNHTSLPRESIMEPTGASINQKGGTKESSPLLLLSSSFSNAPSAS